MDRDLDDRNKQSKSRCFLVGSSVKELNSENSEVIDPPKPYKLVVVWSLISYLKMEYYLSLSIRQGIDGSDSFRPRVPLR